MYRASILIRGNQMIPVLRTHYRFLRQSKSQLKPDPAEKCTSDCGKKVAYDSQILQQQPKKVEQALVKSQDNRGTWSRLFAYVNRLPSEQIVIRKQQLESRKIILEKIRELTKLQTEKLTEKIAIVKEKAPEILKQLPLQIKEVTQSMQILKLKKIPEQMKDSWQVESSEISGLIKKGWKDVQASEIYKIVEHKLSREQLKLLPGQANEQWQIFQTTDVYKMILDSPQTFIKYYKIALVKCPEYWIIFMKSEFKGHLVEVSLWTYSKAKGYTMKIIKFVREAYFEEPQPLKIKKAKKSDSNSY